MLKPARLLSTVFAILVLAAPSVQAADNRQIRGETAEASFGAAYACGFRSFDVAVMDQSIKTEPGSPSDEGTVLVHIQEYDTCLQVSTEYFGSAPLADGEFSQTSLNAASLVKTVSVCGITGACHDMMLDLDWKGYGETSSSRYVSHQDNGESKFTDRWSGTSRKATVTGSASDGAIEYATGVSQASLFRLLSGQVIVASGLATLTASSNGGTTSYTLQMRGTIAQAVLYVPSACGYRQMNVSVTDMKTKYDGGSPEPEKMVAIQGSDYDACEGDARTYQGFTILAPGEFDQTGVDAASLTKTVEVCGTNDCWDIALDLDWTGEGETATSSYVSRQEIDGSTYMSRSASSFRNATLSGTALDGAFDFMAGEAWGTLHTIKTGSTTITR